MTPPDLLAFLRSDGRVLTPSLVTATTSPFFCNATTRRHLRCGAVRAQTYAYLRRIP